MRSGGARVWAERSFEAIHEAGQLRGYATIIRDVSERKRLLDDLRQTIQARDDFLTIASHELKTPLTSLQLQVESLQGGLQKLGQAGALEAKADTIARQADRLTTLMERLLDVTRIASGRMLLPLERMDLGLLVQESVGRVEEMIRRAGVSVTVSVREPIVGQWDRLRLEALVHNLLDNALGYGAGKPIELSDDGKGSTFTVMLPLGPGE